MKKIDTHTWKEFSMKELGFINFHGSRLRYVDRKEGNVPFITAGKENQGIIGTIGNEVTTYSDPITIDMFGNVFYHDGLLAGDDNVYFFVNPQMGKYEKMYIVSVIRAQLGTSFAYVDQFRQDNADALTIALPSKDNQPDFAYMEQYIRSLEQRVQTTLTTFEHLIQLPKHAVDTTEWKKYRVGDLFNIKPTKAYKETNAFLFDGGKTPVVVNSAFNNGIGGYSTKQPTEIGNMITFSDTVDANTIFYHSDDFIGYPHVQGLYATQEYKDLWTENSLKFFATIFRKTALSKGFDYGNKFRRDIAIDLIVYLPVTSDGTPDFAYMEQYMKKIKQRVQQNLDKIA